MDPMGLVLDLSDSIDLGITELAGVQCHLVQSLSLLGRLRANGLRSAGWKTGEMWEKLLHHFCCHKKESFSQWGKLFFSRFVVLLAAVR